jgi:glycerol kinase
MKYAAAIDQGTTGTRFMIFDRSGQVIAAEYLEHAQIYPQPGWVEHDATEIWRNTRRIISATLSGAQVQPSDIAGIGITNQRETTLVWDGETGEPLYNAIVWQCTRTLPMCQHMIDEGLTETFRARAGLPIATYFSGPKIAWLLDNVPAVREAADAERALFGNMDTWLIWNLTGGADGGVHVTDPTNASRTMLMNLETLDWDAELLQIPLQRQSDLWPDRPVWSVGYARARVRRPGRPASRAVWADLLQHRRRQEHLWHRLFHAAQHRQPDRAL